MLVLIYWGSSVQVIITVSVFGDLIVQDLFVNAWPAFARTIFSFSLALSPFSRRWAALMKIEYKTNWIVMIDDDLKNGRNKLGLSFRAKYDQSWLNVFFFLCWLWWSMLSNCHRDEKCTYTRRTWGIWGFPCLLCLFQVRVENLLIV